MAEKKLLSLVRSMLVEGDSKAFSDVLVNLQKDGVLRAPEVEVATEVATEVVTEGHTVVKDKARLLIDRVRNKGSWGSDIVSLLQAREPSLFDSLQLGPQLAPGSEPGSTPAPEPAPAPDPAPSSMVSQQETSQAGTVPFLISCSPESYNRIREMERDSIYPVMEKATRKRLALIINNIKFTRPDLERKGADKDQANMKKLLQDLDYTVDEHNDLTAQEMDRTLQQFAQRPEHEQSDSAFVVIMSHGIRDAICGVDYDGEQSSDVFKNDRIFNLLNTVNCAGLRDKPKVILIQACRGEGAGHSWVSDSVPPEPQYEDDSLMKRHKEKDFICLCSSTPENKSYRSIVDGTPFVRHIVEIFYNNAHKDHVDELFRQVQQAFQDFPQQMPTKERTTLMKKFYLFPGF
ncbi:caspase a-like [Amia ocellicauda]|uniref:caspase a-like n=1 Tax=Amia ocellicauda TaxID=2972642 RepID=UPI003463E073